MKSITDRCVSITKNLRSLYYRFGSVQEQRDNQPFGGSIRESIGPFPEFIMKGRFCNRSLKGYCTPCFYSRLPEHSIAEHEFDLGYLSQVDYIIDNFDELVVKNQIGKVAFPGVSDSPVYGMVCTPTGSYFDEKEYPRYVRKENLKKLINKSKDKNCIIALHIESHAEDIISYFKNPDQEEIQLLHQLNARIILGFESINEVSRNLIYAKHLSLSDFELAVSLLKDNEFAVGAFVFAGLFALTDEETVQDVNASLKYLKKTQVAPVLMFANTQKYTIADVLKTGKLYKLLDPRTVLRIVNDLIELFGCDMSGNIDPWFIADPKGGPPDPNLHIFNAAESTACKNCGNKIYESIERLRITKDLIGFRQACDDIATCQCRCAYKTLVQRDVNIIKTVNLEDRLEKCLNFVMDNQNHYTLIENPWIVKAELLCYGLNLTDSQIKEALSFNPYLTEKGLVHAVHIKYQNVLINICVAENFCKKSPYSASQSADGVWTLIKDGKELGAFEFLTLPCWIYEKINEITIGDLVRPHAEKCISLWPSIACTYVQNGLGCKFCGLNYADQTKITSVAQTVEAIEKAISYNPEYEVNLSGGTCGNPDFAIDYLTKICSNLLQKHPNVHISVECAPPTNSEKLLQLHNIGVTAIIMNLEIYDDPLRKKICPGKSGISREHYFKMLEDAVTIFGKGNVSSVLIVGLQPKEDIINACDEMTKIGVVPTLIPFKPLDDTPLANHDLTDPDEYITLSKHLALLMKRLALGIQCNSGCASCGACSLEIDLSEVLK